MKDIKTSLLESNDDKFFFTEVQNEITNEAGYVVGALCILYKQFE